MTFVAVPPRCGSEYGRRASKATGGVTAGYVHDANRDRPVVLDDGTREHGRGLGLAYSVDSSGNEQVYHTNGLGSARSRMPRAA